MMNCKHYDHRTKIEEQDVEALDIIYKYQCKAKDILQISAKINRMVNDYFCFFI